MLAYQHGFSFRGSAIRASGYNSIYYRAPFELRSADLLNSNQIRVTDSFHQTVETVKDIRPMKQMLGQVLDAALNWRYTLARPLQRRLRDLKYHISTGFQLI